MYNSKQIHMSSHNINLYIVGGFLLINLIIGIYHGRNTKNIKDFAVGNRFWSSGALVMTYLATSIGDGAIFRMPQDIFKLGWGILFGYLGLTLCHFLKALVFAPKMHFFSKCFTLGDIMKQLYGENAQIFSGFIGFIYGSVVTGLQVYGMGVIFEKFLGIDAHIGMIVSGSILMLYSAFGGIKAVVATDIFQFIVLVVVLSAIATLGVMKIGGTDILFSKIPSEKFELFSNPNFSYYLCIFIMLGVFQSEITEPARILRMLMNTNAAQLRKTFLYVGFSHLVLLGTLLIIGLSCFVLYPDSNPREVIATMGNNLFPESFRGVIAIGLLAVLLSTGDSHLHAS